MVALRSVATSGSRFSTSFPLHRLTHAFTHSRTVLLMHAKRPHHEAFLMLTTEMMVLHVKSRSLGSGVAGF